MRALQARNAERWKTIGYEPPEDLLPLVRAASQGCIQPGHRPAAQQTSRAKPESNLAVVDEAAELSPAPVTKSDAESYDLPPQLRFGQLRPSLTRGPVRRLLATGDLDQIEDRDLPRVRIKLRTLLEKCSDRLWIDESRYVNDLLTLVNQGVKPHRSLGFHREDPAADVDTLKDQRADLVQEQADRTEKLYTELNAAVDKIDEAYRADAAKLDHRYQDPDSLKKFNKPSRELIEARLVTKRLLKQNRIEEATKQTAKVAALERADADRMTELAREKYLADDRKLKEEYANRREITVLRYKMLIETRHREMQTQITAIDNAIAKLGGQQQAKTSVTSRGQSSGRQSSRSYRPEEGIGSVKSGIPFSPPKLLNRDNDIRILDQMTEEILDGQSPRKAGQASIIRTTLRKGAP
jgi:hypothetical protein